MANYKEKLTVCQVEKHLLDKKLRLIYYIKVIEYMRLPFRKPGKYMIQKADPNITQAKFDELNQKLEKLLKIIRPPLIKEVNRLSQTGDFSENHAYQVAKGKLRGINQRILEIENTLKNAEIIKHNKNNDTVQIGHSVTIENNAEVKTYRILGSAETDPTSGTISQHSPLGSALLGKKVGDMVKIQLTNKKTEYKILKIE